MSKGFSTLTSVKIGNLNIGELIANNLGAIIGLGFTGIGFVVSYLKYRGEISKNKELLAQQTELLSKNTALTEMNESATTLVTGQAEELEMYKSDTTSEVLQTRINEMSAVFEAEKRGYERQISDLQKQLERKEEELENRPIRNVTETVYK